MRSDTSSSPARRLRRLAERRSRRRPAIVAASLAVGLLATAGVTGGLPVSSAQAVSANQAEAPFNDFALVSYSLPVEPAMIAGSAEASDVVTAAREALATAEGALDAAETVQADIAAAGVDLGATDAGVATDELSQATERLERGTDAQHTIFLPGLTEDVVDLVDPVDARVTELRAALDAAIAEKARLEAEAAEKARLEAEAAAASEAAAAAARTPAAPAAPNPVYATGGTAGDNSPAGAQASARAMLPEYGWGDDQFACLVSLWNKESGWNYQAYNRSSGATGIPQALPGSKMASAGGDWQTNAATQVRWGLGYIAGRYGSPCGAWSHSQSVGWY
ncbi:lytic transglycosylase domain-containing protein [Microbacterium sp. SLBN-146]|uniref:aggregation-promoting factor C-terminal-like domain-containing protein n=1 Tax=Microbacterium sp. SLBN-146 TaxID=2768457 RepID=UPI00116EF2AB|nr:lytic transglycosylase domain-containing protein [Microbacterium sp. SLBN-146]TQJ31284.1 hypothetical protein FBY39_1748 [Microbacterium sp. SLBN-146]